MTATLNEIDHRTMTATLNEIDQRFIAGLEAAVAERGEHYVYPELTDAWRDDDYWRVGAPVYSTRMGEAACIIGLAIEKSDIGVRPGYASPSVEASHVLMPMGVSGPVAEAADHAQSRQDAGFEWGAVLDAFKVRLAAKLEEYDNGRV